PRQYRISASWISCLSRSAWSAGSSALVTISVSLRLGFSSRRAVRAEDDLSDGATLLEQRQRLVGLRERQLLADDRRHLAGLPQRDELVGGGADDLGRELEQPPEIEAVDA